MPSLVVIRSAPDAVSPITSGLLGTNIGLILFIPKWLVGRCDPLITHTAYVEERSVPNNGRLRATNTRQRDSSALINARCRNLDADSTRRDAGRHEWNGGAHRLRRIAVGEMS